MLKYAIKKETLLFKINENKSFYQSLFCDVYYQTEICAWLVNFIVILIAFVIVSIIFIVFVFVTVIVVIIFL